jgi:putative transposase
MFAAQLRKRRVASRKFFKWIWHLDKVFVKINGELHYLWRAVDHEGEVLEAYVTKRRDRHAAQRFLRKAMKRYGNPQVVVTDRLGSYKTAMKMIGNAGRQATRRWLNNRAENSPLPFRRKERVMGKFRSFETLQKFVSAQSSIHNHFSHERHLNRREVFKENRIQALVEWRQLAA